MDGAGAGAGAGAAGGLGGSRGGWGEQGGGGGACLVGEPHECGHEPLPLAQLERRRGLLPVARVRRLRGEAAEAARDAVQRVHGRARAGHVLGLQLLRGGRLELRERDLQR